MIPPLPLATYRLQFNRAFTFNDARDIVPYLHALGISHCYASPLLKARSGSSHGYDIVDHNALNPELGTPEEFQLFVATLHDHDMGLILDIVPNHMGIGGSDNSWWLDILENGPASPYADYFDIDWQPVSRLFSGRVLLPILGDYYGQVLDRGEIKIIFDHENGSFAARYYDHLLPLDPKTYPQILGTVLIFIQEQTGANGPLAVRLRQLIADCQHIPGRQAATGRRRRAERRAKQVEIKRKITRLSMESVVREAIVASLAMFNMSTRHGRNYYLLHRLLEKQAYRLAFWKVAADEINYRRFFDINTLAGLRQELNEVFTETHRLVFQFIAQGLIQGLRIDHPDGLFDPRGYYERLRVEIRKRLPPAETHNNAQPSFYLVAEKILAIHEELPREWPIHGTTGYDFANLVNGLFLHPEGEKPLASIYQHCTGKRAPYDDQLYEAKKLIIKMQLLSELTVLTNQLRRIAEQERHTRDFTLTGLREALTEMVACFPVYRTYVTTTRVSTTDQRYVEWAANEAKQRNPMANAAIIDFVCDVLLLKKTFDNRRGLYSKMARFAMKFQQYTAPVMAKAQEDTLFYRDCRLLSLNEVGGDPRRFGVSRMEFLHANQVRQQHLPYAMLATSTHDSKRSEDVRARLNVLSEIPELWKQQVKRWQRLNRRHTLHQNGNTAPSSNDEYLIYQTLLGTWPLSAPTEQELARYQERITAYMLKATREAKVHSSWLNPNSVYEEALVAFIAALLQPGQTNGFLIDFTEFSAKVSHWGLLNSLAQTLLKLTAPGVPDIYQGNEAWDFSLVDPDNRRPVDFVRAQNLFGNLTSLFTDYESPEPGLATLLATLSDGRAKLLVTSRTLRFRSEHPALFAEGLCEVLPLHGALEKHVCVQSRSLASEHLIAIAPRFFSTLWEDHGTPYAQIAETVWGQTCLCLPENATTEIFRDIITGAIHRPIRHDDQAKLMLGSLLRAFPVALLYSQRPGAGTGL
jgi:(1->4)-alpha-D-glucan 1-alpha-D-glucosylmutase